MGRVISKSTERTGRGQLKLHQNLTTTQGVLFCYDKDKSHQKFSQMKIELFDNSFRNLPDQAIFPFCFSCSCSSNTFSLTYILAFGDMLKSDVTSNGMVEMPLIHLDNDNTLDIA